MLVRTFYCLSVLILVVGCANKALRFDTDIQHYPRLKKLVENNKAIDYHSSDSKLAVNMPIKTVFKGEKLISNKKVDEIILAISDVVTKDPNLQVHVSTYRPEHVPESISMLSEEMADKIYALFKEHKVLEDNITIEFFEPGCSLDELEIDYRCYLDQQIVFTISKNTNETP